MHDLLEISDGDGLRAHIVSLFCLGECYKPLTLHLIVEGGDGEGFIGHEVAGLIKFMVGTCSFKQLVLSEHVGAIDIASFCRIQHFIFQF